MTVALRGTLLPAWRQEQIELWMSGHFVHPTETGTLQANARAIGICMVINKILELDFPTLQGELNDEQERPTAIGPGSSGQNV